MHTRTHTPLLPNNRKDVTDAENMLTTVTLSGP